MRENYFDEEEFYKRKRRREAAIRKKRAKRRRQLKLIKIACLVCALIIICMLVGFALPNTKKESGESESQALLYNEDTDIYADDTLPMQDENAVSGQYVSDNTAAAAVSYNTANQMPAVNKTASDYAFSDEGAVYLGSEEMTSQYGIVVNTDEHRVVAFKNAYDRINPASMTKILTLLVACENIENPDAEYTVTIEATDYAFKNDCIGAGFEVGETVKIKDLMYGTILPSGGEAAYALACCSCDTHEEFVAKMNEKLVSLGLSDTAHFTNCVGVYDENHYCTAYDMAVILEAAMDNPLCREVLSAHRYITSATLQHPEGIDLSNFFLRRIEDKDTMGTVLCAKTGYVYQSGNCAASSYIRNDGANFICVTVNAHSGWRCIYDHVAAYNIYAAGNTGYKKQ